MLKKAFSFLLFIAISIYSASGIFCYATENTLLPEISEDSDFTDDRIIVVLDNETSINFKEYDSTDFSKINCKQVTDLSSESGKIVKNGMQNIARHVTQGEPLVEYSGINFSDYHQILCLELNNPGKANVIRAIEKIEKMDGVLLACPNYKISAYKTSNDPHSMDYRTDDGVDYLELIGLYDAWDITTNAGNVTVGVIDSGIDDHPDLIGNLDTSRFVNCVGSDDEPSFCQPEDDFGHGTGVAGVIGAVGNNNKGISGVCWNVKMISIKALNYDGHGSFYEVLKAVNYATSQNLDILNMSLGLKQSNVSEYDFSMFNTVLESAINNFDGLVVCAAGNDSKNIDSNPIYPASYDCPKMITVGASTSSDTKLDSSNYSSTNVDLFAPGYSVLSTMSLDICPDDPRHDMDLTVPHYNQEEEGYHLFDQTSFATPFVTGVAALMLSINPNLTAVQLKDIITRTVDVVPSLENYCVSGGRLNAYKAVRTAQMYRFAMDSTYEQLSTSDTLYTKAHGVWYDNCECSCRNADLSCDSGLCDFVCDPCEDCHYYFTELHNYTYISTSNINTHIARCLDCGYEYTEAHNMYYARILGNLYNHNVECSACGYSYSEGHSWVWNTTVQKYACTACGYITDEDSVPGIMSLPDPELETYLASLSDEELEEFIASLPEDQVARVTALLPSDDEYLTE